jgi:hypothetical protein
LLGEHEEESSQKITELEALSKRLRVDAQKRKEEKTTMEGMIQSCDELIMEMAEECGLNRMGENDDDEDEDNEGNDDLDDLYDLDDDRNEGHFDMNPWFPEDGSNDPD